MVKHHAFLFRHCVRSTPRHEKLHNNGTQVWEEDETHYYPSDFVNESFPNWNVPDYWCTAKGMTAIERTGQFLFDQLAAEVLKDHFGEDADIHTQPLSWKGEPLVIELQVVADGASHRDVDTSYALMRGLQHQSLNPEANPNGIIQLSGLDQLQFHPSLFVPIPSLCPNFLADNSDYRNRVRDEIQNRLNTVPPPEPGLESTLPELKKIGGVGKYGTMEHVETWIRGSESPEAPAVNTTSPFPVLVNRKETHLAGPINLIHWFAEMAFYSRAGGVAPPLFLKNANLLDVYRLLEWSHWMRTILNVENSVSASRGSVMAQAVLNALKYGSIPISDQRTRLKCQKYKEADDMNVKARVTLIVGHDGDMDALATAFHIRWRLFPPYYTSPGNRLGEYVPTPPGSAMHFKYDLSSDQLGLDFWYPVFLEPRRANTPRIPKGMSLNISGILERAPMVLNPRTTSIEQDLKMDLTKDEHSLVLLENGMDILRKQLDATLQVFPDAQGCHLAFVQQHSEEERCENTRTFCNTSKSGVITKTAVPIRTIVFLPTISLFSVILWLMFVKSRRCSDRLRRCVGGDWQRKVTTVPELHELDHLELKP